MKPIFSALSPNIEQDDLRLARHLLKNTSEYSQGDYGQRLAEEIGHYLGVKHASSFQSGREALWAISQSLAWPVDSEILVPGFTCAAAINPLIWSGLKPVFVDINQSLNIDLDLIEAKITQKTKGILVQHTFGLPVDMARIRELAEKHNLTVIEDCAHSLGARFQGQLTGTWGEAAFFSFGRDKIISSVFGGLAVSNDPKLGNSIRKLQKESEFPEKKWIRKQLRHPVLTARWVQPWYGRGEAGRKLLLAFQKTGILSKAMTREEKRGERPSVGPMKLPNELAVLALNQFLKLDRFNDHRNQLAIFYRKKLADLPVVMPPEAPERVYLKFPLIMPSKEMSNKLLQELRRQNIYLYDGWKDSPVVPSDVQLSAMGYEVGICPMAEDLSGRLVNLPTHINVSLDDATRISDLVQSFFKAL